MSKGKRLIFNLVVLFLSSVIRASATTHYVDPNSPAPSSPYTTWSNAATTIQDAIDAATPGDQILVTNGIYQTGGRVATIIGLYGSLLNRVLIDKPVTVQSVNGPSATIIQGYQVPGKTNGIGAARCVFLTNNAALIGFTLTQGATLTSGYAFDLSGGGVYCRGSAIISNCVLVGNAAASSGGGVAGGTLNNCSLSFNTTAEDGGAAHSSKLFNCYLTSNTAALDGGGAENSYLNNCVVATNTAFGSGGGAYSCNLTNCTLVANIAAAGGGGASSGILTNCGIYSNSAGWGGGVYSAQLNNCTLTNNSAVANGGGAHSSTVRNCAFAGNSALCGGGASAGSLTNCTLTRNSAAEHGGGVYGTSAINCIIYYNSAPIDVNFSGGYLNYCCTAPLPPSGTNNIIAEPQLAGDFHITATSPCRNAGNTNLAAGLDIDGELFTNPRSIGCDEFYSVTAAGSLAVAIQAPDTNVVVGHALDFSANIGGIANLSIWDFGDQNTTTNRLFVSHTWDAAGDYTVRLNVFNGSNPDGVSASVQVHVVQQQVYYVAADSTSPSPPYTSWSTAAQTIQDAVNAANVIGGLVLVSNGVYGTGGRVAYGTMTNRVAATKQLAIESVNGPCVTMIRGRQIPGLTNGVGAMRCVFLGDNTRLVGFTLYAGATYSNHDSVLDQSGGGVWCSSPSDTISNCVIINNAAKYSGGGAYSGTFVNCYIISNTAPTGGGANSSILTNCTLMKNLAQDQGGGAANAILYGSTVAENGGTANSYKMSGGGLYNCFGSKCVLSSNTAIFGGGAYLGALTESVITSNSCDPDNGNYWDGGGGLDRVNATNCSLLFNYSAESGGGAVGGILDHCLVASNTVANDFGSGGGIRSSTAYNSTIIGNTVQGSSGGGGAAYSTLYGCILVSNSVAANCDACVGWEGGGASASTLTNCILRHNSARNGGGAASCALVNCVLTDNIATNYGGGSAYSEYYDYSHTSILDNCTVANNRAGIGGGGDWGGASYKSVLNNCIVYYNSAPTNADCSNDALQYSCTTSLAAGPGNITNAPSFINLAAGNLRLQIDSLCIDAGSNLLVTASVDLDGRPRITGNRVDMGAYEFQAGANGEFIGWLSDSGLPTDGSADYLDTDLDGLNNWQEWLAGTDPTNSASVLQVLSVTPTNNPSGINVTWQSVTGVVYYVQRSTNLTAQPAFLTIGSNVVGQAGTTGYTDTNATQSGQFFYRIGVQR